MLISNFSWQEDFTIKKFNNGEVEVNWTDTGLKALQKNQSARVIIGLESLDGENLIALASIVDEIKRSNSHDIILYVPLLPYSRANKPSKNSTSPMLNNFINVVLGMGIKQIITADIHAQIPLLEESSIKEIPFEEIFGSIATMVGQKTLILATDKGAERRALEFWNFTPRTTSISYAVGAKTRKPSGVVEINVDLTRDYDNVIIVDDMIDSGKTMFAAIYAIKNKQPKAKIKILVTHILSRHIIDDLRLAGVEEIITPDLTSFAFVNRFICPIGANWINQWQIGKNPD